MPELAKSIKVAPSKINGWIRRGELDAMNIAADLSKRPLWRVSREAWQAFLSRRTSRPAEVASAD